MQQNSGLFRNWRAKINAPNLWLWLGAKLTNLGSDSRCYREDAQQPQGQEGKRSWIV